MIITTQAIWEKFEDQHVRATIDNPLIIIISVEIIAYYSSLNTGMGDIKGLCPWR